MSDTLRVEAPHPPDSQVARISSTHFSSPGGRMLPIEETGVGGRAPHRGRPTSRHERLTIIYGILGIVIILVVLQLWLLTATMNAYLGGEERVIWPAATASVACFCLNLGLLRYLYQLER